MASGWTLVTLFTALQVTLDKIQLILFNCASFPYPPQDRLWHTWCFSGCEISHVTVCTLECMKGRQGEKKIYGMVALCVVFLTHWILATIITCLVGLVLCEFCSKPWFWVSKHPTSGMRVKQNGVFVTQCGSERLFFSAVDTLPGMSNGAFAFKK